MKIARNDTSPAIVPKSHGIEGGVSYRSRPEHAERVHRQIIENIEAHEDPDKLAEYLDAEDLIIDSLFMDFPHYAAAITDAFEMQRCILIAGQTSEAQRAKAGAPVIAQSSKPKGNIMFATNKTEGTLGPWITWTSNGSAVKGFAAASWVLRHKPEGADQVIQEQIEAFQTGAVFDLDSLKLGWEKDGATGQAPERRYSSHYSVPMPRPDESKKPSGAYAWSNALQVRIALTQDQAVTWEQGSFGAYEAASRLFKLIEQQFPGDNTLPVIRQTGVEEMSLKSGTTRFPIFTIDKWVPRPAILKDDAPAIATNQAAAQPAQQTQQQETQPAPAAQAAQASQAPAPEGAHF